MAGASEQSSSRTKPSALAFLAQLVKANVPLFIRFKEVRAFARENASTICRL